MKPGKTSPARLLKLFVLFWLTAANVQQASATHLAGADIEYQCIGVRKWKVTLTVYRFCSGTQLCANFNCTLNMTATPSPTISVGGLNPNGCTVNPASVPFTVQLVKVEDAEKSRLVRCPGSGKNECTNLGAVAPGPFSPSVEKYIFEGILNLDIPSLDLAGACPYWDISWEQCCRNATTNVSGQPSFFISATINVLDATGPACRNNSPVLKQDAVIVYCAGRENVVNMGAFDPDHDSLSYLIVKSQQALNVPVTYIPPYNETYPFPLSVNQPPHNAFPGGPYVILDTITGDLSMNPLNTGVNPIAGDLSVRIFQWRYKEEPAGSGTRVPYIAGITMRNLQIYSVPCPANNPPRFETDPTTPGGTAKYNWAICAGEQICFSITAKDVDYNPAQTPPLIDSTWITWTNGVERPGKLTFTPDYDPTAIPSQKPREDRWRFCWQTEASDESSVPYYFTVRADDNRCPNPGKIMKAFSVRVVSRPEIDLVKEDRECNTWVVKGRKLNMQQSFGVTRLEVAKQPNDYTFSGGAHVITATDPNPGGAGPAVLISDTLRFPLPGKYLVKYTVNATAPEELLGLCQRVIYDTIEIYGFPLTLEAPSDTFKCRDAEVTLTASLTNGTPPYTYRWHRNTLFSAPVNGPLYTVPSYTASDQATTTYIIKGMDLKGCVVIDTVQLEVKPSFVPIQGPSTGLLVQNEYEYRVTPQPFHAYKWSVTNGVFKAGDSTDVVRVKWTSVGAATLSVKQTEDGCEAYDSVFYTIGSVGLKEQASLGSLRIMPNPNSGVFRIELESERSQEVQATLHNILGALVWSNTTRLSGGANQLDVQVDVPDGLYLLTIYNNDNKLVNRMLISR